MRRSLVFCILAIVVLATESSAAQSGQAGAAKTPPHARTATVKPVPAKTVNVAKKASTAARSAPSPVQQKLRRNPGLATRIAGRLPAGTDVMTAASGFRTLGQFVSAVNGSNTAHVPFAELKRRMAYDGMTLSQAIQDLRPQSDYRAQAQRAETEAAALIGTEEVGVSAMTHGPR